MPNSRRTWAQLEGEVRILLRETLPALSGWPTEWLLSFWNHSMALRSMQLGDQHEGWIKDIEVTDLESGVSEYTLPEGLGRVQRVSLVRASGGQTYKLDLDRDERIGEDYYDTGLSIFGSWFDERPTYRLIGELLVLEPPPRIAITGGLEIEIESSALRFTGPDSMLDLRFPDVMETLLVFDTWDMALGSEEAQGNIDEKSMGRLRAFHRKYEEAFDVFTSQRSFGRVFGKPMELGD